MEQIAIQTTLAAWDSVVGMLKKKFLSIPDEEMYQEIAPGRNRVIYLLGHLTAVNDWMLPTLGFGERLYPEMEEPFLSKPDRAIENLPSLGVMRQRWTEVNDTVRTRLVELPPDGWLAAHTRVSPEDFAANPLRNRLSVVNSRVGHMWLHLGQLALLDTKKPL